MSKRKNEIDDVKRKYARMAIESGNMAFIARKVGVNSATLSTWVNQYRDEIEGEMAEEGVMPLTESSTNEEIQKKYDHAMKLLGEKELEIAMLREMVKKNFPNYRS